MDLYNDRLLYRSAEGNLVIHNVTTGSLVQKISIQPTAETSRSLLKFRGSDQHISFIPSENWGEYSLTGFFLDEAHPGVWATRCVDINHGADDSTRLPVLWADDTWVCYSERQVDLIDTETHQRISVPLLNESNQRVQRLKGKNRKVRYARAHTQRLLVCTEPIGQSATNGGGRFVFTMYESS